METHLTQCRGLDRPAGHHDGALPVPGRIAKDLEDPRPQAFVRDLVEAVEEKNRFTSLQPAAPGFSRYRVLVALAHRVEEDEEQASVVVEQASLLPGEQRAEIADAQEDRQRRLVAVEPQVALAPGCALRAIDLKNVAGEQAG